MEQLDEQNDQLRMQLSILKSEKLSLASQKEELQCELQKMKFDFDYNSHQTLQE